MDKKTPDIEILKNIGDLITKKESVKKPYNTKVTRVVKSTYEKAIKQIEEKESEAMSDASDSQRHLLGKIQKTLVEMRKTDDFDKLDEIRKDLQSLNKKVSETGGSDKAKKFILNFGEMIHSTSKIPTSAKSISNLSDKLGMENFSLTSLFDLSALADPTVYKKDSLIRDIVGLFASDKKREQLQDIKATIKAKEDTLDPFSKKKIKEKKLRDSDKPSTTPTISNTPSPITKATATSAQPGETFIDSKRTEYEKWAIGWRDKASGKMVTKAEQERINKEYNVEHGKPETKSVPASKSVSNKASIIRELKVDKIIVKELVVKPKDADLQGLLDMGGGVNGGDSGGISDILPDVDIDLPDGRRPGRKPRMPSKKGGLGKLGRFAGKVARFAGPALLAYGAANAIDYAAGKYGIGKDVEGNDIQIDEEADESNWRKMSAWEKLQSGAARGVEHLGSSVGLDNMARQAEQERIAKESDYLKFRRERVQPASAESEKIMADAARYSTGNISTKPSVATTMTPEIKNLSDIVDTKFLNPAPVIITNPAPAAPAKETVIMPVKGSVRPSDSSFNRFQDRVFAGF